MIVKIAYAREAELKPLIPLLKNEIDTRGFTFELIKVDREDELKFYLDKVDLVYIPLPILNFVQNLSILSNGSYVSTGLRLQLLSSTAKRVLVPGSNSTEFYLVKMLYNSGITPVISGDYDAKVTYDAGDVDLLNLWNNVCQNSPLILKVLATKRLDEQIILQLKVLIRESASKMVEKNEVSIFSKELGLKGRSSIECFFKLCREKNLCSNVSYRLV